MKQLVIFEEDLIKLEKELRFGKAEYKSQKKLAKNVKDMRSSSKTLTHLNGYTKR